MIAYRIGRQLVQPRYDCGKGNTRDGFAPAMSAVGRHDFRYNFHDHRRPATRTALIALGLFRRPYLIGRSGRGCLQEQIRRRRGRR
jgi:hypothetical protein